MDTAMWKPSRFNMWTERPNGTLLVYNSFSSAFVAVQDRTAAKLRAIFAGEPVAALDDDLDPLAVQGILVPTASDELRRAQLLHESRFGQDDHLQLILMPTEQCNFRCVYCYEEFLKGRMAPELIAAIVRLVERQAPHLRSLSVMWFGGEPLAAFSVIEEISHRLRAICTAHGITYGANMTTNGYLLTPERAERCLAAGVSSYQITLDGPPETHNTQRLLAGGGETFDTIYANLRALRASSHDFHVRLRVNYTPKVAVLIPRFLERLGADFGNDRRFSIHFHPVGNWGGPENVADRFAQHEIETCDQRSADDYDFQFMTLAPQAGFGLDAWKEFMQPAGSVCYAADPRSFVIGSDGTVYKCTVAFNDPRNQIGHLALDGTLVIREELHELWTRSGEETDHGCQQCGFRPACQGNLCPLERLNTGHKVCPPPKRLTETYLTILSGEALTTLHSQLDQQAAHAILA